MGLRVHPAPPVAQAVPFSSAEPFGWRPALAAGGGVAVRPHAAATIALCMIVRDEAHQLAEAIASVRGLGLADEVVVVDTGSTDGTPKLAAQLGCVVLEVPWADDFAAARNAGVEVAVSDWILVLDADERLEATPGASALALRQGLADVGRVIYQLEVDNVVAGGNVITHRTPRLFPRHPLIRYQGAIHEVPVDAAIRPAAAELLADYRIRHLGYEPEVMARRGKAARNIKLLEAAVEKVPHSAALRLYLSQAHHVAGDYLAGADQARTAFWFGLAAGDGPTLEQAASDLISCLGKAGHVEQAALEGQICLLHRPLVHPGFWVALGNAQNSLGRFAEGASSFTRALAWDGTPLPQVDRSCTTWMPHAGTGLALAHLGFDAAALACLEHALLLDPCDQREAVQAARDEVAQRLSAARLTPTCLVRADEQAPLTDATAESGTRGQP